MKELIDRLTTQAGISPEQAAISVDVIKNFTKEKFPMFASAIDSLFADKKRMMILCRNRNEDNEQSRFRFLDLRC